MTVTESAGITGDMSAYVRQSKITIPRCPMVPRPHLVARVEEHVRGKVTVISAPAGWGKTTLLAEWAAQTASAVAWISLGREDNTPTGFFRSLAGAVNRTHPGTVDDVWSMLRLAEPAPDDRIVMAILERLGNLDGETVIVLDDYQRIEREDIHRAISLLLDDLPPRLHLLISSRGEPSIPIARLRMQGDVATMGAADIRFTTAEAEAVFALLGDTATRRDDIATLVERTEGWIAGLRLAALSLRSQADPAAAIARFTGTHRDIADYFSEEVLEHVPEDLRTFLLQTSILDEVSAPLADAVTGRTDGRFVLDRLGETNLFVMPLDTERQLYRYHGLFHDLLQSSLIQSTPDLVPTLHARAARWYESRGLRIQAGQHALRTNDPDAAIAIIDRLVDPLMTGCGATSTAIQWLEQLPRRILPNYPRTLRWYAWALTLAGRADDAEALVIHLERKHVAADPTGGDERTRDLEAELFAIRSRIAAYRGDHRATVAHGRAALSILDPVRKESVRADVVLSLGYAHRALGDPIVAGDHFRQAAQLGRASGNLNAALWGMRYFAATRVWQGQLREADSLIEAELARHEATGREPGPLEAALLIGRGEIAYEQNDLTSSRAAIEAAIPLIQEGGDAKMLMNGLIALALLDVAEGNFESAATSIRRADTIFGGLFTQAMGARIALLSGNHVAAARWASTSGFDLADEADFARGETEQTIFSRIMLAADRSQAPVPLAERLLRRAEADGRVTRTIELLAMLAVAHCQRGDYDAGRQHMTGALRLAQPQGYVRSILDEGPGVVAVLRDVLRQSRDLDDPLRAHAMRLLTAFGPAARSVSDRGNNGNGMAEPLTGRQLEILRLLAAGHSNRDIAERLFIAEGTVKAHLHQVFGKLLARNRTEAVSNARALRLLDS